MNEKIPNAVLEAAKNLIERFGENIKKIGTYENKEVYMYQFPKNSTTGFPFIYLYNMEFDQAMSITGFRALDILSSIDES